MRRRLQEKGDVFQALAYLAENANRRFVCSAIIWLFSTSARQRVEDLVTNLADKFYRSVMAGNPFAPLVQQYTTPSVSTT